jgi:hypothetical protein
VSRGRIEAFSSDKATDGLPNSWMRENCTPRLEGPEPNRPSLHLSEGASIECGEVCGRRKAGHLRHLVLKL